MKALFFCLLIAIWPMSPACCADAPRLALVIGNSDYNGDGKVLPDATAPHGLEPDLANPVNDAADIRDMLKRFHFDVTFVENADFQTMQTALSDFSTKVHFADSRSEVIVYFAGHGFSFGGNNYLVPIKAELPGNGKMKSMPANVAQTYLTSFVVPADDLLTDLSQRPDGPTIVIIDACRNNPWNQEVYVASRGDVPGGLVSMSQEGSSIVAFSAWPGERAQDGAGQRNSPFAKAFLVEAAKSHASFVDLWQSVTNAVYEATARDQEPWLSGSLRDSFCLTTCPAAAGGASKPFVSYAALAQQITDVYEPLDQWIQRGDVEWADFQDRFNRQFGRRSPTVFHRDPVTHVDVIRPMSDAEWDLWIRSVKILFKSENDAVANIVMSHTSILDGGEPTACMTQFLTYKVQFDQALAVAEAHPAQRTWPTINWPTCLKPEIHGKLATLKAQEANLYNAPGALN